MEQTTLYDKKSDLELQEEEHKRSFYEAFNIHQPDDPVYISISTERNQEKDQAPITKIEVEAITPAFEKQEEEFKDREEIKVDINQIDEGDSNLFESP